MPEVRNKNGKEKKDLKNMGDTLELDNDLSPAFTSSSHLFQTT